MATPWTVGGAAALQQHAPTVAVTLVGLVSVWPDSLSASTMAAIRTVTAEGLGLRPLGRPPTGPRRLPAAPVRPATEVMAFAEQLAVDVSVLGERERADWSALHGEATLDATLAAWVADVVPRVRATLDGLFGSDEWYDGAPEPTPHGRLVSDEFCREVALLDVLDPVTTELVRLRVAGHHGCRACLARRSVEALEAGADAATFAALDHYRSSDLGPAQQAALALTDAMVWTPADLRARDLDDVRRHLTAGEAVEVVLDVMRWSTHKIDVALGTDVPRVAGLQLFETDETGAMRFP